MFIIAVFFLFSTLASSFVETFLKELPQDELKGYSF
jgi:hypothetical protein